MASLGGDNAANTLVGTNNWDIIRGLDGNDSLVGRGGADSLYGGTGNDALAGGHRADYLAGDAGNDYLDGGAHDDVLVGGSGNDKLNGRDGVDTAVFAGAFATYGFTALTGGIRVTDGDAAANGNDGVDSLFNVETLVFRDRSVAVADLVGGNGAPDARDDSATATSGVDRIVAVLANDRDPDGDPLGVTLASGPAHGTCTVNADGTVTYRSADGYAGPDSFTYRIDDGEGGTDTATVTLAVVAPGGGNAAPVLSGVNGGGRFVQGGTTLSAASGVAVAVDANMTVSDDDLDAAGNYAGAVIQVLRLGGLDAADRFALATAGRSFDVVGNEVQVGGRTVATLDSTAGQLAIAFTDADGLNPGAALVDEILASITWRNVTQPGTSPTLPATVDILVRFDDGSGSGNATTSATARLGIDGVQRGGAGTDVLTGTARTDFIEGQDGNDTIDGGNGNDWLAGGAGNDTLTGGDGSDVLSGGTGRDLLVAGDGGGTLEGGAEFDIFFTGAGRDIFVYRQGDTGVGHGNRDIINLFDVADGDRLDVSAMDANLATAGDDRFAWIGTASFSAPGQLRYFKINDYWIVEGNNDGAGGTDFQIKLVQMVDPPTGGFFVF